MGDWPPLPVSPLSTRQGCVQPADLSSVHAAGFSSQTAPLLHRRLPASVLPYVLFFVLVLPLPWPCVETFVLRRETQAPPSAFPIQVILVGGTQTTIFRLCNGHCGLLQPIVNVALLIKLLSTFFRPAHTWRLHQQFLPEDTEVGTKLWGQAS